MNRFMQSLNYWMLIVIITQINNVKSIENFNERHRQMVAMHGLSNGEFNTVFPQMNTVGMRDQSITGDPFKNDPFFADDDDSIFDFLKTIPCCGCCCCCCGSKKKQHKEPNPAVVPEMQRQ